MLGARGWGEGDGELFLFNGDRVSVWDDKKSWRWMVVMIARQRECA